MHTSQILFSSLALTLTVLLQVASADTTLPGVSEFPDGQPQAPTNGASSGWSSSWSPSTTDITSLPTTSSSYDNPFTIYTSMTNSLGVITGMPAVVTSQPTQPAAVTSQPVSPTLPVYSGYYYNTTSSTLATSTVPSTQSSGTTVGTTTGSSATSSPTFAQVTTNAANSNKLVGAGFGLVVAALGFCLL